jgi:hypothetical protein
MFGANSLAEEAGETTATGAGHQEKILRAGCRGLLKSCHYVHGDSIGGLLPGGSAEFANCSANFAGGWISRTTSNQRQLSGAV